MGNLYNKPFPPKLLVDICGQCCTDTYNEEIDIYQNVGYKGTKFLGRVWQTDPATGDSVDIYVRPADQELCAKVVIAFKGTREAEQSFYNAVAVGCALTSHAGSVSDAQSMFISTNLLNLVDSELRNSDTGMDYVDKPAKEVEWVFTGHSRGGVLAAAAHDFYYRSMKRRELDPEGKETGTIVAQSLMVFALD